MESEKSNAISMTSLPIATVRFHVGRRSRRARNIPVAMMPMMMGWTMYSI